MTVSVVTGFAQTKDEAADQTPSAQAGSSAAPAAVLAILCGVVAYRLRPMGGVLAGIGAAR